MEPAVLGLVPDSSVLIEAERRLTTALDAIANLRSAFGDLPVVLCPVTIAELGHGIYRAETSARARFRRAFLDDLKRYLPVHPITAETGEIVASIGGTQAAKGVTVPFSDLVIGACAIEPGYAVVTHNLRHFRLIPDLDVR